MKNLNSFNAKTTLTVGGKTYTIFSLNKLGKNEMISRLPMSLKILLENLLRYEDGKSIRKQDIEALINWDARAIPDNEIAFMPARVLLQDFTGVPCAVDLAVMRDAIVRMGGDPRKINPLQPVDLVIDHSVQVDDYGSPRSFSINSEREFERNKERYGFLRWTQQAFKNFRVVPPDTGIVHQVNLEYFANVVFTNMIDGETFAFPDTLVGTDSHTTMINGLGVLGWGVGGIEAEAAMLGQAISMLIPQVVGFQLHGTLPPGATATDVVLTVTQMLREKGVVGKFVEFYGPGLASLTLADRATIANMAPEYGATMGYFPVDEETLNYLRFTGRNDEQIKLVEAYCKEQGLFHSKDSLDPVFSDRLELDLSTVEPCIAGPKRPQDRVPLSKAKSSFRNALIDLLEGRGTKINAVRAETWMTEGGSTATPVAKPVAATEELESKNILRTVTVTNNGIQFPVGNGSVVIAAITSCTNTSNPSVMIAAGLLAKKAVKRGLHSKPWVKTSLAPGSKVVTDYLNEAKLSQPLDELGFHLVGYGCTTCIGNSGPLPESISEAIQEHDLVVAAVLSGNRNFEGRINGLVRANYLASPPLVVAYALAGTMNIDIQNDSIGSDNNGHPVYLRDIWPTPAEVEQTMRTSVKSEMFKKEYDNVFEGNEQWAGLPVPAGDRFVWTDDSTYIRPAPFFEEMPAVPAARQDIRGGKVLAVLGDSVTTDHISPAGSIPIKSPAGQYLISKGVDPKDFNSYGARRGNHEVMMRGTFANIRLRNLLVPGTEGGVTIHHSSKEPISIFDAAMQFQKERTPLVIIAGKEYGSGSSRDWAAKGPRLLGVRAVIAESFERIHRSNLIGMGVLPLQFEEGETRVSLNLTGFETYDISGIANNLTTGKRMNIVATDEKGKQTKFVVICRIDTPMEVDYYKNDGILQYVLRTLMKG
ncbi:MAG: aconitate hydratase AcnA [Ignavibacteriae bacterium]|nr:aconitate hydratase AcnA [Ignavibacteria bacterium]MBI3364641.1 aconitate hydratase AcnA [Ignavibacteriota bacterium]